MRNIIIIIILSFQCMASLAQADRSCVEWSVFELVQYVDLENSDEKTYSYLLFSDTEFFRFHPGYLQHSDFSKYSFADGISRSSINFPEDLKDSGKGIVFYDFDNSDTQFRSYSVSCSHNEFGEEDLFIQRYPFANRITVDDLSYTNKEIIYSEGKKRNRDFFQDFLQMDVKAICVDQLDVFDEVDGDNMGYLVRDDLVEVLEEQGDWVRVKYLKTDQIYWIYMSCLE